MKDINLSYIICTYNRLNFLKILLSKLLENINSDEEIIVIDGNSSDGSKIYLQQLYAENKIDQFISEADHNQAHGWNKGLLMARGKLIKKLIDDDVHDLNAIHKCRDFMLANPDIDICISNHLEGDLNDPAKIGDTGRLVEYMAWKNKLTPSFTFSDVSLLLKRSSLSFLGLYDTQFKMIDWEYSLRVSYLQATIAYYTGYNSLTVKTPGNVTSTATKKELQYEENIGTLKYNYAGDHANISFYSRIKIWLGQMWYKLFKKKRGVDLITSPDSNQINDIYQAYYQKLNQYNNPKGFDFIY